MMSSLINTIVAGLTTIVLTIGGGVTFLSDSVDSYLADEYTPDIAVGTDTVKPIAGSTYYLAGSGLSSSDTSIVLTSFTIPQSGYEIQDSDLSDTFYITLEPGSRTRQEIVSCTTIAQSSTDTTATFSGCSRGLSPLTDYTASTTLAFAHSGGSNVIFSDPPQLFNQYAGKDNDETITGNYIFTGQVTMSNFPITPSSSPATATTTGTVELATGGEAASSTLTGDVSRLVLGTNISTSSAPSSGNVVVVTGDDGNIDTGFLERVVVPRIELIASSTFTGATSPQASYISTTTTLLLTDTSSATSSKFSGFVTTNTSIGATATVQFSGVVSGFSGLTRGAVYYASTSGSISTATGTTAVRVGTAVSATELLMDKGQRIYGTASSQADAGADETTTNVNVVLGFRPSAIRFHGMTVGAAVDVAVTDGIWANGSHNSSFVSERTAGTAVIGTSATDFKVYRSDALHWQVTVINVTDIGFTLSFLQKEDVVSTVYYTWVAEE